MTWRIAKARVVTLIEATAATYLPNKFGTKYKHAVNLDGYGTPPSDGRTFYIEATDAITKNGDWISGYERTRVEAGIFVWLPYLHSQPSKLDDGIWTIYEELRKALLLPTNWDVPTSTIVCVGGPGGGNVSIEGVREDELGDGVEPLGSWLRIGISVLHEEQGT